jgi:hypothetical protein
MDWYEKAIYHRHNICKWWSLSTVISSYLEYSNSRLHYTMLFNFNLKTSFAKSYLLTHAHTHTRMHTHTHIHTDRQTQTHTHIFSLRIGHNGSYLDWKEKRKTIIITYHIQVPHSACLPVMFLSPELVTTTRTTNEVAPWGPNRNFSVTYNMPLLRKWAPSLRASNAVTWKKAGCYITEVKYLIN